MPMISRRDVLFASGSGITAAGLGAIARPAAAMSLRAAPMVPALFLADRSLAGFASAADAARGAGIPLHFFGEDVGSAWLDRLEPLWRYGPQPIVGVTYGGAFFCAERLAQDRGLVRGFALSTPLSERGLADAVELAIAAVAAPVRPRKSSDASRHDRPVVWALVPRAPRPADAR